MLHLYTVCTLVPARWRSPSVLAGARRLCSLALAPVWPRARARSRALPCPCARAWALSAYLPVACRAFYSPIMAHFIRLYCSFSRRASARWACRKLFLRSFSSRRYLSRRRPRGWVTRLDIAVWADLAVLRCFDDLLTSLDIKKIFFRGLDSLRSPCYDVHVNRQDTHNRRIQARQARPTSNSKASRTDRRANASHRRTSASESPIGRAEASERTANSGSKSAEPLQVHRRSTYGRTSQRWRRTLDIVVYPDFPRDESGAGSTCQAEQKDNFRLCQVTVGKSPIGAGAGAGIASRFSLEEVCIRHPITHSNPCTLTTPHKVQRLPRGRRATVEHNPLP